MIHPLSNQSPGHKVTKNINSVSGQLIERVKKTRIAKAASVLRRLKLVWKDRSASQETKVYGT